jgi:hypothetical protein
MYEGQLVFTQIMDHLPRHTFRRLVQRYCGNHRVRRFTSWHQFVGMVFARLTFLASKVGCPPNRGHYTRPVSLNEDGAPVVRLLPLRKR